MRDRVTLAYILAPLLMTSTVAADDRPIPRQPIGPPQDFQMLPVQKSPLLPADNVRIVNKGDQKLSFSYWDGRSTWQPGSVDVQGSADVSCASCSGTIVVVYHDGTQNQRVSLKGGGTYWIGWSPSKGAWLLTNPPN
jgi:hypothetical protein